MLVKIRELITAYCTADYAVRLPSGTRVALRVGAPLPGALAARLPPSARSDGRVFALITAWNPCSEATPRAQNRAAQRRLLGELRAIGNRMFVAVGRGPGWREPSLAITAIDFAQLDALARAHGQNAVLTCAPGGTVRLRLCRDDWPATLAGERDVDVAPRASA